METRAVAFDYFYTLVDPSETKAAAAAELHAALAPHVSVAAFEAARDGLSAAMAASDTSDPTVGTPVFRTFREGWIAYGERLCALLGVERAGEAYADTWATAHASAPLFPEVAETMSALAREGRRVAILSDADCDYLYENIARNHLRTDVVVCSEEIRCNKPSAAAFNALCRAVGLLPHEIVYVGDNPYGDVDGARRAGLACVWIDRGHHVWPPGLEPPNTRIGSLSELKRFLR